MTVAQRVHFSALYTTVLTNETNYGYAKMQLLMEYLMQDVGESHHRRTGHIFFLGGGANALFPNF